MCSALCRILKLRWRSTLDAEGTYWDVAERDNKTRVTWWSVLLGTSKVYFTFIKSDSDLGCYMLLLCPLLWSWFGQGNFSCGNFTWRLCKGPIECGSKELCHVFLRLPCALVISSQCFTDTHEGLVELWFSCLGQNSALHMAIALLQVAGFWKWRSTSLHWSFRQICLAPQATADWCSICSTTKGPKQKMTEARCAARWSLAVIIWARSLTYQIF